MRRACLDGGSKEVRDDHEQDRSENEVGEAEFFAERGGVSLHRPFSSASLGAGDGSQRSGAPRLREETARGKLPTNRRR
jgi:hypothetical protein